jgi:hypothetical protein
MQYEKQYDDRLAQASLFCDFNVKIWPFKHIFWLKGGCFDII